MEPKNFKHILACVDDSELGQMALVNAIHQAKEDGSKLSILSVFESDDLSVFDYFSKERNAAARDDVERALERYRQIALVAGIGDIDLVFAEGEPGEEIVKKVIPEIQPDMVVIGSHSQNGTAKYFGSQSKYVANNSSISVMVIR